MIGDRNDGVPKDRRLVFRVGINIGDIIVEDDDIYGDGVNVAARMEGLAEPGGICVSRTVFNHVKGKLDLTFENLGEKEVKNIAEPVTVYRVVPDDLAAALVTPVVRMPTVRRQVRLPAIAAGFLLSLLGVVGLVLWQPWAPDVVPALPGRTASPLPDKPSIAVLPFANMSDDPQQEYFADGMTDDLITDLSKISGLFVIARNSTFSYKGKQVKVRQIAAELGVRYVLEGSVRRAGDEVRINAQLIDATTGGHVWAERYDRQLDNIFAVQDEIMESKNITEPVTVYRVVLDDLAAALVTPVVRMPTVRRQVRLPAIAAGFLLSLLGVVGLVLWQPWAPDVVPALPGRTASPLPDKPSIAVLPFANMSDDPQQEYFADGMTDDLITDLSKISGLFVIARNSTFSYKGKQVKVRQIAAELGVRYVLEGSVRRAGDEVRINAQLIDATTGGHVWAERYDRQLDNIFAVQDEIMERVVLALELHLTDREQEQRNEEPKTTSLEAYDLVLKARKLMTRFDHKAAAEARDHLQRAVEIDPAYAEAHSLLGFYYFDEWRIWGRKRNQNLARALELATAAVKLSPLDPAPHVLLALVHQWRREFDAANAAADKALDLQPKDAITLSNLGSMLNWAGRSEEALGVLQQAIRLDPFHPPNYLEWLAFAYEGLGDYDQCVEAAKRGIALDPDYVGLQVDLAVCYAALGREEEARAAGAEILRTNPRFTLKAYASYAPFSDERDLKRNVELLRKVGVPE